MGVKMVVRVGVRVGVRVEGLGSWLGWAPSCCCAQSGCLKSQF